VCPRASDASVGEYAHPTKKCGYVPNSPSTRGNYSEPGRVGPVEPKARFCRKRTDLRSDRADTARLRLSPCRGAQPAESSSAPITFGTLKNGPSVSGAFCNTFSSGKLGSTTSSRKTLCNGRACAIGCTPVVSTSFNLLM